MVKQKLSPQDRPGVRDKASLKVVFQWLRWLYRTDCMHHLVKYVMCCGSYVLYVLPILVHVYIYISSFSLHYILFRYMTLHWYIYIYMRNYGSPWRTFKLTERKTTPSYLAVEETVVKPRPQTPLKNHHVPSKNATEHAWGGFCDLS